MFALTGATGHLGQSILRQLHAMNLSVGAVIQPSSNRSLLESYCDWIFEATLDDVDALTKAFKKADVVIHSAALIDIRRGNLDILRKVNVEGTRMVVEACRRAGVRRLIYIGSIEAYDLIPQRRPVREDFTFADGTAILDYGNTKADASRWVVATGFQGELETIVICPTGIIGPWDYKRGLFTTMLTAYFRRKLPVLIPGGFDFVDVRDVAGAVISAAYKGRSGEIYLVSGNYVEIWQMFQMLEEISGVKSPRLILPLTLARLVATVMEGWAVIFDKKVPLTKGSLKMLSMNVRVSSAKAAETLGFQARSMKRTLEDVVKWHRDPLTDDIDCLPTASTSFDHS